MSDLASRSECGFYPMDHIYREKTSFIPERCLVTPMYLKKISQTVGYAEFTDGGSTVGTFALTDAIPVGAFFLWGQLTSVSEFLGDTSAALTVGDGSDVDRYNASTIDVFSDVAAGIGLGDPAGTQYHNAAKSVTLTITAGSDWGAVTGGELTLELFYMLGDYTS